MGIKLCSNWTLRLACLVALMILTGCHKNTSTRSNPTSASVPAIRFGISPYPDTGLPIMTDKLGLFKQNGLNVNLKVLQWGEVMPALASGSVDVVVQNMNSFDEVYANLKDKGVDIVFYRPLFVFEGGGLMVRGNSGMLPLSEMLKKYKNRQEALKQTILQLRGKEIITTQGTDHEQMVLAALRLAGLKPGSDVTIKYAEPDDAVAAFVGGEGNGCTGGLVQRLAILKRGGYVLFNMDDVTPPVINGLITTRQYAQAHHEDLDHLANAWFQTVSYMNEDPKDRSKPFLDFLAGQGSARFTPDQYVGVWKQGDIFPKTQEEATAIFNNPSSNYYWKNSWDSIGKFLVDTKKISAAPPDSAYRSQ